MQKKGKNAKVANGATVAKVTTSKAAKPEGKQPEKASAKAEKPQAAQQGKASASVCAASNEAIKQAEKAAKVVWDFVSVDDTRKDLKAPYHDHKAKLVVATDGRAMIATKYGYKADVKDSRTYPDWTKVLPADKGLRRSLVVEPLDVLKVCANASRLARLTRGIEEEPLMRFTFSDRKSLVFTVENITRVLSAMDANRIKEIKADDRGVAVARNADTTIIAMPLRGNYGAYGFTITRGRKADNAFIFDVSGVLLQAPDSSICEGDRLRLAELRKGRDTLGKKELAELAKLEKRFEAESVIDSMLPKAAKPQPQPAKPEEKPEGVKVVKAADDARFNDWLREIEGLVLHGRLNEINAERITRAQEAAKLASREAVLLALAQVAKLTKDERPKAKRIGELWLKITEARAKELNARFAMGQAMPRGVLKPGVAVVVQHPYKDKRMACMVDTFQACDWSWDKSEGKFQVLTMAWTEDGKSEAKQKAPSKPQGKQDKPEVKQGKAKAASPQKAAKAPKTKGVK